MTPRAHPPSPGAGRPLALTLLLSLSCAAPVAAGAPAPRPEIAARQRLARFLSAVDGGRWAEAHSLLSARWRGRSTPAGLAADRAAAGPVAARAVERARALLDAGAPLELRGRTASLPVGQGKAAVLVEEGGDWFVDAVE